MCFVLGNVLHVSSMHIRRTDSKFTSIRRQKRRQKRQQRDIILKENSTIMQTFLILYALKLHETTGTIR